MNSTLSSLTVIKNSYRSWEKKDYILTTPYSQPGCFAEMTSIQLSDEDVLNFSPQMRGKGIGIKYTFKHDEKEKYWIPVIHAPTEARADVDARVTISKYYSLSDLR